MCIIVHMKAKQTLSKQLLQNCYDNNSHGWGILWAEKGKLFSTKNTSSFDDFLAHWHDVPRTAERALHFRIKTHGERNRMNCHPFFPAPDIGMMHNGIIDVNIIDKTMNDTFNFCKYELEPLIQAYKEEKEDVFQSEPFLELVTDVIGGGSKVLLMDKDARVVKLNPKAWVTRFGCDFSNGGSFEKRYNYSSSSSSSSSSSYSGNTRRGRGYWSNGTWVSTEYDNLTGSRADYDNGYANPWYDGWGPQYQDDEDYHGEMDNPPARIDNGDSTEAASRSIIPMRDRNPHSNAYDPLKAVKSDLYAGNKTDEEGQAAIEAENERRRAENDNTDGTTGRRRMSMEELAEEVNRSIRDDLARHGETGDGLPLGDDPDDATDMDNDMTIVLEIDAILTMTDEELKVFAEDEPESAACTIRALADACAARSIFELPILDKRVANSKLAVST